MKLDTKVRRTCTAIADLLKEERQAQGLSMRAVAERAGLTQPYISYLERGERIPTIDSLIRISEAMDLDLSKLIQKATKAATSTGRP